MITRLHTLLISPGFLNAMKLFFGAVHSGISSLIYEITWVRQATLTIGVEFTPAVKQRSMLNPG